MDEEQKSLELARLMGWDIEKADEIDEYHVIIDTDEELKPYESHNVGLSQFAKIQLAFPSFVKDIDVQTFTQSRVLNQILVNEGVII